MSSVAAGLALLASFASITNAGASGSGVTTRFWDCCKPSCGWPGKADVSSPVQICDINNNPLTDSNTQSACDGGTSYMCSTQQPFVINDTLAMGFAAVNIAGGSEATWCCACYALTFTSTSLATSGKTFIVQAVNTGADLGSNQFDLAFPGGGVGIFDACTVEWDAPAEGWGAQYGGVAAETDCTQLPAALQPGCDFRFGWFEGADNPTVNFEQVQCPTELTQITGCTRDDDDTEPSFGSIPSGTESVAAASAASSSSAAAVATTSSPAVAVATTSSSAVAPATTSDLEISSSITAEASTTSAAACGDDSDTEDDALQTHWGQCGGSYYSGPTSCSPPYTCQTQNPYYAQCL